MFGASIRLANLTNATGLTGTQLNATLSNWESTKFNGTGVSVAGLDLHQRYMFAADLTGISLSGANLSNMQMQQVKLFGSTVAGANLSNADLRFAQGYPAGGSSATYATTKCPDFVVTNGTTVLTCVGHGLSA